MCGIFGSNNFSKFVSLYDINKQRGYFSFGMLGARKDNNSLYIKKQPGEINLDQLPSHVEHEHQLFLGHTQAPTSQERNYTTTTSHPFESQSWIIAHNGIINNYDSLKNEHTSNHTNPVDSSIIPVLLEKNTHDDILETLEKTFSLIKGLVGAWCYNKRTGRCFLVRMGSTLYITNNDQTFSSIKLEGLKIMPDNSIYEICDHGIIPQVNLQNNTSFFTID